MAHFLKVALAATIILASTSAVSKEDKMTALRICADPGNMPLSNTMGEGFQNKIAEVIADGLGTQATYFYRPYLERGLTRQTFKNNSCDVLMGMSPDNDRMITSTPLYRSTFVIASRADRKYDFKDLDDPRLKELTVGVFQHSAMRTELMEHGVNGENLRLHIISHDADLVLSSQPTRQIQDVVDGKLDVAGAWGPLAGWYNTDKTPDGELLDFLYMNTIDTVLPMEFELSVGLKKRDTELLAKIEKALVEKRAEIKQILMDYGVPLVECSTCIVSGDIKTHGPYKPQEHTVAKFQPTEQTAKDALPAVVDAALASGSSLGQELLNAVLMKDFPLVKYLIKRGADMEAQDANQLTPLMNAVKGGNYKLVQLLLRNKANPNSVDIDNWTASMHAAWINEPKMLRLLGGHGADFEMVEKLTQSTAMGLAIQKGKTLAVVAMLDGDADIDFAMGEGEYTPLMIAANQGHLPSAQVLTQYGAKVDKRNAGGVTALMIAAANNKVDIISLLLKAGADASLKDDAGKTALDSAKARKAMDAVAFLTK